MNIRWMLILLLIIVVAGSGCSISNVQNDIDNKAGETADRSNDITDTATDKENDAEEEDNAVYKSYADYAEWAEEMLIKNFWNEEDRFMNNSYPYKEDREVNLNYWWKAHAVDAMMDGYERTGDKRYTVMAEQLVKGIIVRNRSLYNEFYDDMEWLALSALRLYDATGDETIKSYVLKLWNDIKTAWWEDEVGGMAWKKDSRHNRNTCSNSPAAILAARLYQHFGSEDDLEWAKKIYTFQKEYLVDKESGIVFDGLVVKEDGTLDVNTSWIFTYGQGTYLGAGVELYKITGDEEYLKDAEKTCAAAINVLVNSKTGILKDEGQGDGGLFKGILIRYMVNLFEVSKNNITRKAISEMISHNSKALIASASEEGLFGTSWNLTPGKPLDLPVQLSGAFLLEGAAKIEKLVTK